MSTLPLGSVVAVDEKWSLSVGKRRYRPLLKLIGSTTINSDNVQNRHSNAVRETRAQCAYSGAPLLLPVGQLSKPFLMEAALGFSGSSPRIISLRTDVVNGFCRNGHGWRSDASRFDRGPTIAHSRVFATTPACPVESIRFQVLRHLCLSGRGPNEGGGTRW